MKRRRFFQAVAALPAAPALLGQQAPASPQAPAGGRGGRGQATIPKFELTPADLAGDPTQRFFTGQQFSALRKLGEVLMPPMRGYPGALECGAPEFLDFLIASSPADRQKLYRAGLDALNTHAKKRYNKTFAELNGSEADAVVRPLLAPAPWVHDAPQDPIVHFVTEAHRDIRTATQNSREWAEAGAASGRRGVFGGGGLYLNPIDPVYKA